MDESIERPEGMEPQTVSLKEQTGHKDGFDVCIVMRSGREHRELVDDVRITVGDGLVLGLTLDDGKQGDRGIFFLDTGEIAMIEYEKHREAKRYL